MSETDLIEQIRELLPHHVEGSFAADGIDWSGPHTEGCPGCAIEPLLAALRTRLGEQEQALRAIQGWDCLNPPDPNLCADHPWLKRLVDAALSQAERAAQNSGSDPTEVHPPASRAEAQAGLNGPGGSPTSLPEPVSEAVLPKLTNAMREADRLFESGKTGGGGTRHYIRDCLIDALEAEGLAVVAVPGQAERAGT